MQLLMIPTTMTPYKIIFRTKNNQLNLYYVFFAKRDINRKLVRIIVRGANTTLGMHRPQRTTD